MTGQFDVEPLTTALAHLRDLAGRAELPLATAKRDEGVTSATLIARQLDDYVLPRLGALDAPVLVVVGGSTGAGKSTLVNSLIGEVVSPSGVLRPTTRTPVLVHHPDDTAWFEQASMLPDVPRADTSGTELHAIRHVASDRVGPGLAILDAPDFDSIDERNRELADQLLAAADLWLFVTSAARYADQVPWDRLRHAADRNASVAVVLDRTDRERLPVVRKDLARLMTMNGLSDSPLFTIVESDLHGGEPDGLGGDRHGLLPPGSVDDIAEWLDDLAADAVARRIVIGSTLDGAIRHLTTRTRAMISFVTEQADAARELGGDAKGIYDESLARLLADVDSGALLRGEVSASWQEFVGAGELTRTLEEKVEHVRSRLFRRSAPAPHTDGVEAAVGTGLHLLILDHAEQAAAAVARTWSTSTAGAALIDEHRELDRASRDLATRAERLAREWRAEIFALVERQGADKLARAKALTWGVNVVGVSLMVVVFAGTAGLTGTEIGIAGGTAALGHKVLEAVFGDKAIRELAHTARADLHERVESLLHRECERYRQVVPEPGGLESLALDLNLTANSVEAERIVLDLAARHGGASWSVTP